MERLRGIPTSPHIIQVMDDHDLVLKPMVTLGSPNLKNPPYVLNYNFTMRGHKVLDTDRIYIPVVYLIH